MNRIILMGNISSDIETRLSTDGNNQITMFNIAINRKNNDKDGNRPTDFFKIKTFGNTAKFVEKYFEKGNKILIEGRMENNNWTDENGVKHYDTDYIAEQVYFCSNKRDTFTTVTDENLPF